jgi:hypothetical protein
MIQWANLVAADVKRLIVLVHADRKDARIHQQRPDWPCRVNVKTKVAIRKHRYIRGDASRIFIAAKGHDVIRHLVIADVQYFVVHTKHTDVPKMTPFLVER